MEKVKSCSFLKNPLSIEDLLASGAKFEVNTDFDEGLADELYEEISLCDDDEDSKDPINQNLVISPWCKPFDELRPLMKKVNEYIYKKILKEGDKSKGTVPPKARVSIGYNAFWELQTVPFDSSYLRGSPYNFYTGCSEVLEGLEAAVSTMCCGEEAQFLISYNLLFRELGCPPRVKPRADGLFIITVNSFSLVGDLNADLHILEADRDKFSMVFEKAKEVHLKGMDFFRQRSYKNACQAFEKALSILKFCHLKNEEEEREQNLFLVKLYTNIAVIYNKLHAPKKVCIMCKEIYRLTNNKPSCKALFQEGRALIALGEYQRARNVLVRAQNMEPQNIDLNHELIKLEESYTKYKKYERNLWSRAFGKIKISEAAASNSPQNIEEFEIGMLEIMNSFKDNFSVSTIKLPTGLTHEEMDIVDMLAKRLDLNLKLDPLDEEYFLSRQ